MMEMEMETVPNTPPATAAEKAADGVETSPPRASRRASRGLVVPFEPANETLLQQCEAVFAQVTTHFAAYGHALETIRDKKLYKKTHRSFGLYCQERCGLGRRTAYQKIEDAQIFETVRNCAQFSPVNEFQIRQLSCLPTPELQQDAWVRTVTAVTEKHLAPTAALVRDIVKSMRSADEDRRWTDRFIADRIFPGIPFRWEIESKQLILNRKMMQGMINLPTAGCASNAISITPQGNNPLVIVSPDRDLLRPTLRQGDLQQLVDACATAPEYRFLLWTSKPDMCRSVTVWPTHVSLALRISQQTDLTRLDDQALSSIPIDTLWLTPKGPLELTTIPTRIHRVLIGGTGGWEVGVSSETILALRRLLGTLLMAPQRIAIHVATAAQQILFQ
jgi:hypothetical protein